MSSLDTRLSRDFACFQNLNEAQAQALADSLKQVTLPKGHVIFKEGETGDTAYFLVSGQVEVSAAIASEEDCSLATISGGQILGEISLLTGSARTATAVTLGEVEMWEIARPTLEAACERGEAWATRFLFVTAQTLANRLGLVNQQVVGLLADRSAPVEKQAAELDRLRDRLFSEWSF
jgi:CRP/FNR family transcriptional regulator, cyclic AMP receptor protein